MKDSDDEDVSNVDIDKQIEQIFNSKKSVKETMVGAQEGADSKFFKSAQYFERFRRLFCISEGEVGRDNKQKLELAKKMAEKINARKVLSEFDALFRH